jgi:hypothetical protein
VLTAAPAPAADGATASVVPPLELALEELDELGASAPLSLMQAESKTADRTTARMLQA